MMTRDAPTFQHERLQMQRSRTPTFRPEVILNVGPSAECGDNPLKTTRSSFRSGLCCSGRVRFQGSEGVLERFGAEHEPACALPSTQGKKIK